MPDVSVPLRHRLEIHEAYLKDIPEHICKILEDFDEGWYIPKHFHIIWVFATHHFDVLADVLGFLNSFAIPFALTAEKTEGGN